MQDSHISAREIADAVLERGGRHLIDGDFAGFATCFWLPYTIETFDVQRTITSMAHMERIFREIHDYYRRNSVTELYRLCIESQFRGSDIIESVHKNHAISRGVLIEPAFPVFTIIRRFNGEWRIVEGRYACAEGSDFSEALRMPEVEASPRLDKAS